MPEMLPIITPVMDEREAAAASRAILSAWVTQGPEVAAFECEFASTVGAEFACAVSSCTTALHLALLAAGVGPGDEVITVSHSFVATANAIRYCGATPVFADIDPATCNLDPRLLPAVFSERTRAILCVHQMGTPCDLTAVLAFARQHGLIVIEDAACAIGSEIFWNGEWQKVGRPHGDIACFSFHPRKVITTGEGGMLTTSRPEFDHQFRQLRQHGMDISDTVRHASREVRFESYPVIGYNYRMTDIQAAVGREQLKRLPEIVARRRQLAERYRGVLAKIPGLRIPSEPAYARSNWQSYCVRLPSDVDQRSVMQCLLDHGISTRRGIMCSHLEDAYAGATARTPLRESERAQQECIILPLFHGMTDEDQIRVAEQIELALSQVHAASQLP